jgi:hypothetical protein
MELSVPIDLIHTENVYFVEKKKNIIVEGEFIKIIYSTGSFEMNGLYILIEVKLPNSNRIDTKVSHKRGLETGNTEPLECKSENPTFANAITEPWIKILHKNSNSASSRCNNLTDDILRKTYHSSSRQELEESTFESKERMGRINVDDDKVDISSFALIPNSRTAKHIVAFDSTSKENRSLIDKLCVLENAIIERYIAEHCPLKTATHILKNQLTSNTIRYHSGNKDIFKSKQNAERGGVERFILKISGIWETATNVGITMKFILLS